MTMPGPVNVVKEEAPSVERRRIYEYSVVSATSKETFEQTCGSKLYEKWEPVGGVYVLNPLFIRPTYYQSFRRSFKVSQHPFIYVLVRTDLSPEQIVVQTSHAVLELSRTKPVDTADHPSIIVCGIKSEEKLRRLNDEFSQFKPVAFHEPDRDNEMTAVAIGPIYGDDRQAFRKFNLLRIK